MTKPKLVGARIDIETKSDVPIKLGSYRYAESQAFEVLCVSYALIYRYAGGAEVSGKVHRLDLNDHSDTDRFARLLRDKRYEKHAFNANFERVCLSRWLGMGTGQYIDPKNWHCSAVKANVNGVFGSLDEVSKVLGAAANKDTAGKALIKLFCVPMTPTEQRRSDKSCGCSTFHSPAAHPAEFSSFQNYCDQDVRTEAGVADQLPPIPDDVQAQYEIDQRIIDRGILHDEKLSDEAVKQVAEEQRRVMDDLRKLTGVENPNSVKQMLDWLDSRNYKMTSIAKESREEALADPTAPDEVVEALKLKDQASLSSVAKHKAALDTRNSDGRIRGALQFYGAHTGREAGRGIQPQNLPRYEAPETDIALLRAGKAGREAPRIAKGSVRASLIPAKGHVFVVADYNAIEARVLGWLAGESWVLDEFQNGDGKIYEATAATMFSVDKGQLIQDLKACGKCGQCRACDLRARGKVSALALGYAGGAGALVAMGAEGAGIDCGNYADMKRSWDAAGSPGAFFNWRPELHDYHDLLRLRDLYRDANPSTVRLWKTLARAWDRAAVQQKNVQFGNNGVLAMLRDGKNNRAVLPSGRSIWYRNAASHMDDTGKKVERRTFVGKSKGVGHSRVDTHGGKLCENVTQAAARDVLFDLIEKLESSDLPAKTVLHVHDEVVLEVPERHAADVLDEALDLMSVPPAWGAGLPVRGEGSIMERYGK